MGYLQDFIIHFEGLSIGNHEFDFGVDHRFFEQIEYSEIKKGNINIKLDFERQENMLILQFDLEGEVEVTCDRCNDEFNYPVLGKQKLLVQFGDRFIEETGELIIIPKSDTEINLAPYIYEFISLMLPIQRIHPDDEAGNSTCNPEMLKKLDELSGNKKEFDPRWDALKKLKKN